VIRLVVFLSTINSQYLQSVGLLYDKSYGFASGGSESDEINALVLLYCSQGGCAFGGRRCIICLPVTSVMFRWQVVGESPELRTIHMRYCPIAMWCG
jgi:hypothetical protein